MEQTKDYKEEIQQTRLGSLGSSDGALLAQIANSGKVSDSATKRLAIAKGLIPQTEIPHTDAIKAGDRIENEIYEHLALNDGRWQSNPLWVSERYSKEGLRLIAHPDMVLEDEEMKTLFVYEVKTTKYSFAETKEKYSPQLYIEYCLGKEIALRLGKKWRVRFYLVHYSTDGIEDLNAMEFDPSRLTVKEVSFRTQFFDIDKGMNIASAYVRNLNEYYEDIVDSELLPTDTKEQFLQVTNALRQIQSLEKQVEDFKSKLTLFMQAKNIKSIKNDAWNITLVNESEQVSIDYKRIFEKQIAEKHPRLAEKLKKENKKVAKRKAYVKITIKEEK